MGVKKGPQKILAEAQALLEEVVANENIRQHHKTRLTEAVRGVEKDYKGRRLSSAKYREFRDQAQRVRMYCSIVLQLYGSHHAEDRSDGTCLKDAHT